MPIIEFGNWAPDQPRIGNSCITARNVYPVAGGYAPFLSASALSEALGSEPKGAISFRRTSGEREVFAGTETELYRINGLGWDDVTPAGGLSASEFWRFAVYGDRLIATNGVDNPQAFDLNSDTEFADLPNAPIHRFPIVVRDTLVALDVQDGSGFDVKWSAVNDSEDWTVASGGGSQNFPDGGPVVGGTGGETGIVIQEQGLTRMAFVGGDLRFTFDQLEGSVGCIARNSIVRYKGITFYLSEEGFQAFDGAQSKNISDGVVTKTFFSELARADDLITDTLELITTSTGETITVGTLTQIEGVLDLLNSCVIWKYPSDSGGVKLLIYNYVLNRWSDSDQQIDTVFSYTTASGPALAGFDSDFKIATFDGAQRDAILSTGEMQLFRGQSGFVRSVRGLVDSAHDVTVGKKTSMADTEVTVSGSSNSNGKVSLRSHGRYHRFQLEPTADFTEIVGVEVEAMSAGSKV